MQKLVTLLFAVLFLNTKALKINPLNTKFPKITIKRKAITMGNKFINLQPLYVF